MKKYIITFLSGLAVALGMITFVVYKLIKHNENKHYAKMFLESPEDNLKKKILEDLQLQETDFNKKVEELTYIHEQDSKEEIINAFKNAFGVSASKP